MNAIRRQAVIALSSVLVAGLLAGAATAGNPHGTPPGQAKKQQSSSSKISRGQAKKQSRSTSSSTSKTSRGQAKKQSRSSSSSAGVKPSSTTKHNTHATAGSDQTKLYGNGKTAGEIAIQNGASPSTDLYGPGNSQPHKVAVCSKNGKVHYVDVHALKSHSSASCSSDTSGSSDSSDSSDKTVAAAEAIQKALGASVVLGAIHVTTHVAAAQVAVAAARPTKSRTAKGGVLGATFTRRSKPVAGRAKAAPAVVGAASFTG